MTPVSPHGVAGNEAAADTPTQSQEPMLSALTPDGGARALTLDVPTALSTFSTPDTRVAAISGLLRSYRPASSRWARGPARYQIAMEPASSTAVTSSPSRR